MKQVPVTVSLIKGFEHNYMYSQRIIFQGTTVAMKPDLLVWLLVLSRHVPPCVSEDLTDMGGVHPRISSIQNNKPINQQSLPASEPPNRYN